jgi:hypothetical protein
MTLKNVNVKFCGKVGFKKQLATLFHDTENSLQ